MAVVSAGLLIQTISVSWFLALSKRFAFNEHLLELFIHLFNLDPTLMKLHPNYRQLLTYGSLAS